MAKSLPNHLLQLSKKQLKHVIGFTGHWKLRTYFYPMGIYGGEPICKHCNVEEEAVLCIIFDSEALPAENKTTSGI